MSLYHEAADLLTAPTNAGGSFKSRIFNNKNLKSAPAQVYALVVETCKWSFILKEAIEHAGLLNLEKKLTPVLSLLLVHDLLLVKKGVALPASHGLRAAVERHKARLQAELTKARVARKLGSLDALRQYVDAGEEGGSKDELPHPRWIRINTLKTQLEDQLDTTFASLETVQSIATVRQRGIQRLYIDQHIPNLVAVSASVDLSKSHAYTSGEIIFQDKASCFPAYMLDPLAEDGDMIDACAAPGNKTTHVAAILQSHAPDPEDHGQTIHAFEKNKVRAETLRKMVEVASSHDFTKIHAGQDFLQVDPSAPEYSKVGALLLDPSCSGSGIVGRDDMPELHLPCLNHSASTAPKGKSSKRTNLKRKRDPTEEDKNENRPLPILDDDGNSIPMTSPSDLRARLTALSAFQLSLLEHAMAFPSARKITYSTCSIHYTENENVVLKALRSGIARKKGWRILRREQQVRGLREWNIRGVVKEEEDGDEDKEHNNDDKGDDNDSSESEEEGTDKETAKEIADACIRANKNDQHGTMGFFLAGFVRDAHSPIDEASAGIVRDEKGFIVRDLLGIPVVSAGGPSGNGNGHGYEEGIDDEEWGGQQEQDWNGFDDGDQEVKENEDKNMKMDEVNEDILLPIPIRSAELPRALNGDDDTAAEIRSTKPRKRKRKGKAKAKG